MLTRARTLVAGVTAAAMLAASSLTVVPTAQAASPGVFASPGVYSETPLVLAGHKGKKWKWRKYHRRHHRDWDDDFGVGVFGFAAGALLGSMLAQPRYYYAEPRHYGPSNWHAYCASKYKTYKPWTGTFTGYDGREHRCRL